MSINGRFWVSTEAIPPNVLISPAAMLSEWLSTPMDLLPHANTLSTGDPYQAHCRAENIDPHPARMPSGLVEFFVRFLTDEGDLVLDPFAGSNTTGAVAESLKRRWISIEINPEYLAASRARFPKRTRRRPKCLSSESRSSGQRTLFATG